MSVLNPIIDSIDPINRIIYLKGSATWPPSKIIDGKLIWNPVDDIYPEVRTLRRLDESLRPYDMFCEAIPLIEKSPGVFTGRGLILKGGTRIVPADEDQTQDINGELLSDEGLSGTDLIDTSSLNSMTKVKLNYQPPPATEVRIITSGSGLSPTEQAQLLGIFQKLPVDGNEIASDQQVSDATPTVPSATEIADEVWNKTLP